MAIATIVAIRPTPAAAQEKSLFIWKDVSGDWTDSGNWIHAGGPIKAGFPNGPGDVAFFTSDYTQARTAAIPAPVTITVGEIYYNDDQPVTIRLPSSFSSLVLDNGSPAVIVTALGGGSLTLAHFKTRHAVVLTNTQNTPVNLSDVDQDTNTCTITKRGAGTVVLTGHDECVTRVAEGALSIQASRGAVPKLIVGDGSGPPGSALAIIETTTQTLAIRDYAEVYADGLLWIRSPQFIDRLSISDGRVDISNNSTSSVFQASMAGGRLNVLDSSKLKLRSDVGATMGQTTGRALIHREGIGTTAAIDFDTREVTFRVTAPNPADADAVVLEIDAPMIGTGSGRLTKEGTGVLRLTGDAANTYPGETLVKQGRLQLFRAQGTTTIPGALRIATPSGTPGPAQVLLMSNHTIADTSDVTVGADGILTSLVPQGLETFKSLTVGAGGRVQLGLGTSTEVLTVPSVTMNGGRISVAQASALLTDIVAATSAAGQTALIDGTGIVVLDGLTRTITTTNGPQAIDLRVEAALSTNASRPLIVQGTGVTQFAGGNTIIGGTTVREGTVLVDALHVTSTFTLTGGVLGGTGSLAGTVKVGAATVAPGLSPGKLTTGPIAFDPTTTFAVELNGTTPGSGYDQLSVEGTVTLGNAALTVAVGFTPPPLAQFTIVANDGTDPVNGTFTGLPEGASVTLSGHTFTISYRGGDGNDVILAILADLSPLTYFLAEGATGPFFDDDVLIANANDQEAPITLTFLKEGGTTVVEHRTIPALSRMTVHVDQIPGLEESSASVQVASEKRLPLIVERSMFWDASYYGGHTANAVDQPETKWIFAEGFQGFFDTYILIANANSEPTEATLTFLREGDTPIVKTVPVGPFARKTVYAGDYPEVVGRAFGIVVEATLPVIAERAMYFATLPGRLWTGGHVNTGIVAPSPSWFHAEGATGSYFNTFILLSNPQDIAAHVELRFLLATGEVITRTKTIEAKQRLTVNPATEGDQRLENAALSTIVQSDVPIVSERSMYWSGDATPFGEGHNSSGVVSTATRWGLAEGRLGGPRGFVTYILLANPSTQEANVTITYLKEGGGPPIAKTYTVPATSRYNVDVMSVVPELSDASFGARIEVTNSVPIAVERSLYWNANGIFWAGGTNALAIPLQ